MRRIWLPLFVLGWGLSLMISEAGAVGLGGYIDYGVGRSHFTIDDDVNEWELDTDRTRMAYGLVFDTNVARNTLFNYRLQIGVENWQEENDFNDKLDLSGLVLTHDFGFGVLRTSFMRLWLGPELRTAFVVGSPKDDPHYDIYLFNYGIGPVLGANFNIGNTLTLAVKAGYLFEGYVGSGQADTRSNGSFINPGSSSRVNEDDIVYTGYSSQVFVNFAILFRIRDTY